MRHPSHYILLLACCGLAACASPVHSGPRRSPDGKSIVPKETVHRVSSVHRRDDYLGRYYYEEDRYARLTRWHDAVVYQPSPAPASK